MKLSYRINRSTVYVFDYLTDMDKFASAHPVITKINKQADGIYLVYETLTLGIIPFSFKYSVAVSGYPLENIIVMKATISGSTAIEMTFSLKADRNFTVVEENIAFKSYWPVKSILQRVFKNQHEKLFNNIGTGLNK